MNIGIDYGMGKANIDNKTGIRYGVISQHSVLQAWAESAEPEYGPVLCPECSGKAVEYDAMDDDMGTWEKVSGSCGEYACRTCRIVFDAWPVEPDGWSLDGEYKAVDCLDTDIMIIQSPYYTLAPYCSPCCPGAGNLDQAGAGVKTYCFGHDWFEDGRAPYPVYRVSDGSLVEP